MPRDVGTRPVFAFEMLDKYGGPLKKYGNKVLINTSIIKKNTKTDVQEGKVVTFSIQPIFYEELKK